jgi:hypothetical protein
VGCTPINLVDSCGFIDRPGFNKKVYAGNFLKVYTPQSLGIQPHAKSLLSSYMGLYPLRSSYMVVSPDRDQQPPQGNFHKMHTALDQSDQISNQTAPGLIGKESEILWRWNVLHECFTLTYKDHAA